jgi:hypothetical protein
LAIKFRITIEERLGIIQKLLVPGSEINTEKPAPDVMQGISDENEATLPYRRKKKSDECQTHPDPLGREKLALARKVNPKFVSAFWV